MQLPNADQAIAPEAKVRDYLLAIAHSSGGAKARAFLALGFTPDEWTVLAEALLRHGRECPASPGAPSEYGQKYETRGPLHCPGGRIADFTVAWMIDRGHTIPRVLSAIPRIKR